VTDLEALDIMGVVKLDAGRAMEMLEKQNLIKRTDKDEYVLVRNLSQVDFWSFYTALPFSLPRRQDVGNIHPDDEWMQKLGPALIESDDYLAAKLAIPLSTILKKNNLKISFDLKRYLHI
jgi:membrane protein